MSKFNVRSTKEELLDQPGIPSAALHRNLHELDVINRLLGGHSITIDGISKLMKGRSASVLDLGCGGGDTLREIYQWGERKNHELQLEGVDILPEAISFARMRSSASIRYRCHDFHDIDEKSYDIAICSLFCHHLYDDELKALLQKMYAISRYGIVINDLHRHPLAYYSIQLLTKIFSKSYLVKHDAPLSVLKGFSKQELIYLMDACGFTTYSIQWKWAFRFQIIVRK